MMWEKIYVCRDCGTVDVPRMHGGKICQECGGMNWRQTTGKRKYEIKTYRLFGFIPIKYRSHVGWERRR